MAPSTRKSRSSAASSKSAKENSRISPHRPTRKRRQPVSDSEEDESAKDYDSDALDDDFSEEETLKKRKRASPKKSARSPPKKVKAQVDDDDSDEIELEEGQKIVGLVVHAPKTGQVPAGQISKNTLDFLMKLKNPKYNDRAWFKLNEPVYRQAEKEWKDFVEVFTDVLVEVDREIPPLPPKDVIHRIYRDMRFSNDKTPYKKGFSASFSRSGRKGIFAGYHIAVIPGGESLIAAGSWCPGKNELATIRSNILHNPRPLRQVISSPDFVKYFGEAKPHPNGDRRNIFGMEDELKTAPKGIDKTHKDIDLLKCRSFAIVHRFSDEEVLDAEFKGKLAELVAAMRPLVHCLNDMMTIRPDTENDSDDQGEGEQ